MTAKLGLIYKPTGDAEEYAELALNPWIGCKHGCSYCYGPELFHMTREEFLNPKLRENMLGKLERDLKLLASGVPLLVRYGKEWVEVQSVDKSASASHVRGRLIFSTGGT